MGDISDRNTVQKKGQKLSFFMPLALANDRQLKNFTIIIPADHGLDSTSVGQIYSRSQKTGSVSEQTAQNFD
jgi:hypothetical protein